MLKVTVRVNDDVVHVELPEIEKPTLRQCAVALRKALKQINGQKEFK